MLTLQMYEDGGSEDTVEKHFLPVHPPNIK